MENLEIKSFGLLHENPRDTDYILGAEQEQGVEIWEKLITPNPDNLLSWVVHEPEYEQQKKGVVETNACVSFSGDNMVEYLAEQKRKLEINFQSWLEKFGLIKNGKTDFSDRKTAKGSGTNPDSGNSVRAVDDYIRNFLFCPEDLWPFPFGMSKSEYYAVMPDKIANYHKLLGSEYRVETKYVLPSNESFYGMYSDSGQIWEALHYSPVWVSVDGYYQTDEDGYIKGEELKLAADKGIRNYNHRVLVRAGQWGKFWEVHDSYLNQIRKFRWDYPFGGCKIARIIDSKKKPTEDFIQVGSSILFKGRGGKYAGKYIGYSDGDVLKAIYGEYNKVTPREIYPSLPDNFIGNLNINLK